MQKKKTYIKQRVEVFRINSANAAQINAGATEGYRLAEDKRREFAPFNVLFLTNNDANCLINIKLDGQDNNAFKLEPKAQISITYDDGINFDYFDIKNEDGANNIAAGSISWRVGKVIERLEPASLG